MNDFGPLIEPPPVPFRFGAPGWYVLAALFLAVCTALTILLVKLYRKNDYRRQALRWLAVREVELMHHDSNGTLVNETNLLLKRIAMQRYGRELVAGLRGTTYLAMLNNTMRRDLFDQQDEELLAKLIYQPQAGITSERAASFVTKSRTWIQHHRYHDAL